MRNVKSQPLFVTHSRQIRDSIHISEKMRHSCEMRSRFCDACSAERGRRVTVPFSLSGRGPAGKTAVVGIRDRASNQVSSRVILSVKNETMSRFIMEYVEPGTRIDTDEVLTYYTPPNHETVKHSVGEYVGGMAHTNGVESFWSMLKRAYVDTFQKLSL